LDTESLEWTYLGEWLLPFKGEAHYDSELDAWVGLCLYKEGAGHACCCDVPPAAGCQTMPAWKLGKDLLFDAGSSTHAGAKLVYMGDSRFCLVTCRKAKDYANNRSLRMLDMASFVITDQVQGRRTADSGLRSIGLMDPCRTRCRINVLTRQETRSHSGCNRAY